MTLITFQDGKAVMRDGKIGVSSDCCCGCGRCVVPPHVIVQGDTVIPVRGSYAEPRWRTRAECERCRMCVERLETECNGYCPGGAVEIPVSLAFSADCGSGAAGTAKVGCGTVLSATLTNGGSGYATATFAEPTLTLSVSGGTGGVLTIDGYNKLSAGSDAYYGIGSVTVANGGSGYADNTQATITLGTGDEKLPSSATPDIRIRTEYRPPNDEWTLTQYDTDTGEPIPTVGTGLVISLTLVPAYAGATDYEASAVTVVAGGSGHSVGELFTAAAVEGGTEVEAELEITSVGSGGEVTGIELWLGGRFAGIDTGVIDRVEFGLGGWRGAYRKATVSVCEVAVSIVQESPSGGTGATITATVETAAGANFGKVTGLTVTNGGSGYVALCERKTTVGSCDECPPRESPESATCDETGGCPCGTWVVDSDQTACECCKWTNPDWGVALMNLSDGHGGQIQYMDKEVECGKLRDKLRLIRSYFEQAGWTVTLDENWCPPNVLDVWATTHGGDPDDIQIPLDPEDPCACGFLFRAECESCSRAYPAHIWTEAYRFLFVDDPEVGLRQFEARPFDPSQWVEMPIEDWQHDVPTPFFFGIVPLWPISYGGFARVVYCEGLHAPSGVTIHKNPLGSSVPVFNFAKVGFQNVLLYGDFYVSGQIHGGGLIPGYYSRGDYIEYDNDTFTTYQRGGKIYIPKCGVEITERARCVRYSVLESGETDKVLDDTWATCCAECPAGYRCIFAGDPLDYTVIEENPLP